jgi:hypothetical protein
MNTLIFKRNTPMIVAVGVLIVLGILVYFTFTTYAADQLKLTKLEREAKDLKSKTTVLQSNTLLTEEKVAEYNKILAMLIPDREDYFSIIYALERLSVSTGFTITNYNISLGDSKSDKLAVTVQGDGDPDTFLNFLKEYPFTGGRLITNEKIEFSSSEVGKIRLSLNFYSKKLPKNAADDVTKISTNDLKLMEHVKSKISFALREPEVSASESASVMEYATKSNPF